MLISLSSTSRTFDVSEDASHEAGSDGPVADSGDTCSMENTDDGEIDLDSGCVILRNILGLPSPRAPLFACCSNPSVLVGAGVLDSIAVTIDRSSFRGPIL